MRLSFLRWLMILTVVALYSLFFGLTVRESYNGDGSFDPALLVGWLQVFTSLFAIFVVSLVFYFSQRRSSLWLEFDYQGIDDSTISTLRFSGRTTFGKDPIGDFEIRLRLYANTKPITRILHWETPPHTPTQEPSIDKIGQDWEFYGFFAGGTVLGGSLLHFGYLQIDDRSFPLEVAWDVSGSGWSTEGDRIFTRFSRPRPSKLEELAILREFRRYFWRFRK